MQGEGAAEGLEYAGALAQQALRKPSQQPQRDVAAVFQKDAPRAGRCPAGLVPCHEAERFCTLIKRNAPLPVLQRLLVGTHPPFTHQNPLPASNWCGTPACGLSAFAAC